MRIYALRNQTTSFWRILNIWGQNLVLNGLVKFWESLLISRIKVLGKNFKKLRCPFFVEVSTFEIGNKFWTPQILDGDPFSTGELKKPVIFCVWVAYTPNMSAPATSLKSATLWGSCCLKTTLVVFVAKNCWFYQ